MPRSDGSNATGLTSTLTSCSGCGYDSGFKTTPSTTPKIAVVAPIPSARVRTVTSVNAGDLRSWRSANFRSFISFGTQCFNWIDQSCPAGRQQTGYERNRDQNQCDRKHRRQIGGADSKKQTLKQ